MFNSVLFKISKILKVNYLDDFYREKSKELLMIPTTLYKNYVPPLEFSAIGGNVRTKGNKNCNIFEVLVRQKEVKEAASLQQQELQS